MPPPQQPKIEPERSGLTFALQALLIRHETYVADAEREREDTIGTMRGLERDKHTLETGNADLVEENRALLDRLEALNGALTESETQVKALEATLQSTQEQLRRMAALADRTEFLDRQLATFEAEQAVLQEQVAANKADERTAALRMRQAERTIAGLQDELERIEREACAEKERHRDIVARMERRRAVERELESAAVRLKGAAASKAPDDKASNEVVSHFVRDILQDNANLQLGIVELREMLNSSNDEVARLRDQLLLHVPEDDKQKGGLSPTLRDGLGLETPQSRELHVHHHFHEPARKDNEASRKPAPLQRRISRKKKNVGISSNYSTPSSGSRFPPQTPNSAAAILSQTSVSIPSRPASHRWSTQSHQTGMSTVSSVPSSPSRRTSSLFDRVFSDAGYDSSRPTSPELSDFGSPAFLPLSKPHLALTSMRTHSEPMAPRIGDAMRDRGSVADDELASQPDTKEWELAPVDDTSPFDKPILEEEDENLDLKQAVMEVNEVEATEVDDVFIPTRTLRRAASHESLISVSGMDIHTLQSRPSQLLNGRLLSYAAVSAPSVSLTSSKPIAATMATAALGRVSRPGPGDRSGGASHSKEILSSMVATNRRDTNATSDQQQQTGYGSGLATIGRSVGGWVKGSWGFAPTPAPVSAAQHLSKTSRPSATPKQRTTTTGAPPRHQQRNQHPLPQQQPQRQPQPQQQQQHQHSRLKAMKSSPSLPTVSEAGPISPPRKTSNPAAIASTATTTTTSTATAAAAEARTRDLFRAPGINQPGAIWGLGPAAPAPSRTSVEPGQLDEDALREGLLGTLGGS